MIENLMFLIGSMYFVAGSYPPANERIPSEPVDTRTAAEIEAEALKTKIKMNFVTNTNVFDSKKKSAASNGSVGTSRVLLMTKPLGVSSKKSPTNDQLNVPFITDEQF